MSQVPLAPPPPTKEPIFDRWAYLLWRRLNQAGQISLAAIDFGDITTATTNTVLSDSSYTCVATVSGLTITLPKATVERVGREWTVQLSVTGTMIVSCDVSDTIMTPDGTDTSVLATSRAASLTFRCTSLSTWIIV